MLRGVQWVVSGMALAGVVLAGASNAAAQEPAPAQPAAEEKPVLPLEGDAVVMTVLIKPDKTADFDHVLGRLKEALQKSEKPERKQQAAGWKIFKATQQVQGNAAYIFVIDPVVPNTEYDISRLINEVFPTEVQELFAKYKDAFAGRAISSLTNFMSMSQ
jgi:hypothetical protein